MTAAEATQQLETQQAGSILTEDGGAIFLGDHQSSDAIKHEAQASDLVGIIAACQEVAGPGELDGKLQSPSVKIDGVIIEMFEVFTGRLADINPAFSKRMKPSIQSFRDVWDRTTQVCQGPI